MVKRSIEQDIRNKNFGARNGNYETSALVKNQVTNSVYKEVWEIVGSGKPTGSVLKKLQFPSRYQGSVPVKGCIDCFARISSEERATINSVKIGIL